LGKHVPQTADKSKETEPNTMFNKVILIGRLGQNVEAKTAQNNKEYVTLNIATQESWKNEGVLPFVHLCHVDLPCRMSELPFFRWQS
jgi:Single-strand binding protein family